VGADSLENNTLAAGGYGITFVPNPTRTGTFNISDEATINQIDGNFKNAAYKRGEATGFAAWGGAITFDRDADTAWNYSLAGPVAGANDLYAVALHEIAHTLGFGTSTEWGNLASGSNFTGAAAAAAYGGAPPLQAPSVQNPMRSHWASPSGNPTLSPIYGTNIMQEAAMTPMLNTGARKHMTSLDVGALVDIGWETTPPAATPGDFNRDGFVNAIDFTTWTTAFGATLAGNADGDGDSDGADFLAWQRARGASAFPAGMAAATNVPEPGTLGLLAWLLVIAARRERFMRGARPPRWG
jgi:hypothetical protein